jgi:hypothetical protein
MLENLWTSAEACQHRCVRGAHCGQGRQRLAARDGYRSPVEPSYCGRLRRQAPARVDWQVIDGLVAHGAEVCTGRLLSCGV